MSQQKTRWPNRLARAAAIAALLVLVLALAGKWWLAPALVRWQLARLLPEYWDGSVEIADVDFDYTGLVPITLRGLVLHDRRGRPWLRADAVRLALPNWPSLRPKVAVVILSRPTVTAHRAAGRCDVPLRKIPSQWWDQYVDLKALLIERGSFELIEDGRATVRSPARDVLLLGSGGRYRLSVPGYGPVVRDMRADAFVVTDRGVEIRRLVGRLGGGRIVASMTGRLAPGGRAEARGQVVARSLDLARIRLPLRGAEKGVVTAVMHFRADGSDPNGVTGHGVAFVKGADLRNVPAAAEVLRRAGLGKLDVMRDSDVEVHFRLDGTVVRFERTRIQLPLAAVDVEPGGTLDLWTGRLDAVAVVVLFEKVRGLLRSIPLVSLVVDLTDRLSRFRIEGTWDDPESLVVTPAPVRDIRKASMKFLAASARGSSQFGKTVFRALSEALDPPDPNGPATNRTRREP
ncbi:MAG TPA: hypothetical protein VM031_05350 [Phycisphaerae bacterium]|nr:hypothetical protein [Phycisphaerae bacterium]